MTKFALAELFLYNIFKKYALDYVLVEPECNNVFLSSSADSSSESHNHRWHV